MSLPYDLAGSSSKNRFRLEMLWGVCKMFDLYDEPEFCVIFDYKCDIEVHLKDSLEFFQLKSHKVQSPYTFNKISKPDKATGKSILGKLFVLKNSTSSSLTPIKIAIVSNAFLKLDKKIYSDVEELKFTDLGDDSQESITTALKTEFNCDEVDISNIYYIYTSMNLLNPENDVKGKITGCFEKIKNCEPAKPNALYRLIRETVEEKACYELSIKEYDELVEKKGITKPQLDEMLNKYVTTIDTGVEKTKKYIDNNYTDVIKRKLLKTSLVRIVEAAFLSHELQAKESEVANYLIDNVSSLPTEMEDIVDSLLQMFESSFSIEYSKSEIYVFLLLIIHRWEDGKYDQNDI
jgi:hypothetical protein